MAISSGTSGAAASPVRAALVSNYIDFTGSTNDWRQQYLPDLMEKEAEIYGNRSISGFLAQVSAEEAMSADRVVWSEQGRLHLTYTLSCENTVGGGEGDTSDNLFTIIKDMDGNAPAAGNHGVRLGDTVVITQANATIKGYVSVVSTTTNSITVLPYGAADCDAAGLTDDATAEAFRIMVYGSERAKGTNGRATANKPSFKSHSNKPIILKDMYEVSGSDAAQIGWVEVSGEEGQNGYYWYMKAEAETRTRFSDYLEMSMVEAERALTGSTIDDATGGLGDGSGDAGPGTEGLFSAITSRGHVATGVTGVNAATDLAEFDAMLAKFDANGAIEENMLFVDRATALAIDDMLASMNSYGAGGTSYGVFNNSEDMALNLGFSGMRRGSYDFYKTDWKYLNDKGTRGGLNDTVNAIRGVVVPAGVSSVYDEVLGKNMKRPFLHVRYRASQTESRKMKTWVTGSVGATTSDLDAMEMHYLSERCLVVQGANNFMLLK
jgi:hypothetical protein